MHPPMVAIPAVQPAPVAADGRPIITQRQANWHVHVEGVKAHTAAESSGVDPDTATSLLNAGTVISGIQFPPITAAYVLLLPFMEAAVQGDERMQSEAFQLMAMAFALAEPKRTWALLNDKSSPQAWPDAVFSFSSVFNMPELKRLGEWINSELRRMQDEAESQDLGKSAPLPTQREVAAG